MASVFLSYDHDDSARAAPIAAALEAHGHSVWWDRHIHGGAEYNDLIESAVATSDAVVVLWSENSVRSAWVRDEAGEGRDRGRLVPVLIEPVKPPMGFRQYQTIDLSGWNGGKRIPRLPELIHAIDSVAGAPPAAAEQRAPPKRARAAADERRISRRTAIAGSVAAVGALAGSGIWWATRPREDPRFTAMLDRVSDQIDKGTADDKTVKLMEQAVAARPDSARAWGLLAFLKGSDDVGGSEQAARRALSLDPKQPDALLAMFELQGATLDWFTRDRRLRQIIAVDPNNLRAITELMFLTGGTGLLRESWSWNERALALEPLSPDLLSRRALKLWIMGRVTEADKVIDQDRALYPKNGWVWWVRFFMLALSGRAQAAQAMLDADPGMIGERPRLRLWQNSLPALERPSPAAVARARGSCIESARQSGFMANEAALIMCALGDVDFAFDVADALFFSRGPLVRRGEAGARGAAEDAEWRTSTAWLWPPPAAPMRADRRFLPLCDGIGLVDYWRKRRVKPDFMLGKA